MANAVYTLKLEGPAEVVNAFVPLVARQHGWTVDPLIVRPTAENPNPPEPTAEEVFASQLVHCLGAIKKFLRESATAQAVIDAQAAARTAANAQATGAANLLTLSLTPGT